MSAVNSKPNIFYSSKEYIATVTDTDTLAAGFYGTVFLNKGTAFTVTLGTAADNSEKAVKFINIGAGTVTISDGATIITLAQLEACILTCNGTDWYVQAVYGNLSLMKSTTSAQLASIISDETGSGLLVFNDAPVFAEKITLGVAASATGYIELVGTTSGKITLKPLDAAGTYTLTLPDNNGDADQVIATNGSGVLSWADNATSSGTAASYSETIGDTSATEFTITHNFSSRDIIVEVYEVASPYGRVYPEIEHTSVDTAVITFASAPTASQYRVVILKGGYALPTTSAELAAIISDETGTGVLVFNDSPTFATLITSPIVQTPQIKTDASTPTDLTVTTGAAKTLVLATSVYKDINIAGALLSKPSSSNPDGVNFVDKNGTDTTISTYGFDINEYVSGGFEIQHDYKEGTNLSFHVHFQIIAAPSGTDNVQWRLDYIKLRGGVVLEPKVTIDTADTPVTTQYASYFSAFADIDGTNIKIGDQFLFNIWRVAADGDAFAGDALLQTCGIHYQIDTIGSRAILTK